MILDRTKEFRSSTTTTAAAVTIASAIAVTDVITPQGVESMVNARELAHEQQVSSRYLGLVVVPGDVIVKLEVETRGGEDA